MFASLLFAGLVSLTRGTAMAATAVPGAPAGAVPPVSQVAPRQDQAAPRQEPCRSAAACFEEAKALTARDVTRATEAYRALAARYPKTPWAGRAALELGRLAQALNDPSAAAWWTRAAAESPLLADYALYALAQFAEARQDWPTAASALESLLAGHPQSLWRLPGLYELGEVYRQLADCPRARGRWDMLASRHPGHPLAVAARLRIADCWMAEAQPERAVPILRRLWWEAADAPEETATEVTRRLAELAARVPVPGPTADERYQRAVTLSAALRHQTAMDEFEAFVRQAPEDPRREGAQLRIAVARVQLKQYRPARHELTRLAETAADEEVRLEAFWWLARVAARLDDEAGLLAAIRRFDAAPQDIRRAKALVLLGDLYAGRQELGRALEVFERLLRDAPDASVIEDVHWHVGWLQYQAGRPAEAVRTFEQFRRAAPRSVLQPQVLYWEGRSHERAAEQAPAAARRGDQRTAAALYATVCRDYRRSYYCHQAERRLMILAGTLGIEPVIALGEGAADPPPIEEAAPPVQDLHYQKAKELLLLDWRPEAVGELRLLADRVTARAALVAVATLLSDAGDYAGPLRMLKRHFPEHLVRGGVELPPWFRRMAYPVGALAAAVPALEPGLDPLLVAAIMREESEFDPQAVSRSGALGLMQVLPTTAHWVARRLGLPPPDRSRLLDQDVNIRVGAAYLTYLGSQFAGDPMLMAAGYNAGPQAVIRWLQARRPPAPAAGVERPVEQDEFIETIPFGETRFYVKRVLRSYAEYLRNEIRP